MGGYRRPLLDGHEALLRELTAAKPGITLVEIKRALAERGIEGGPISTIWTTLRRLGLSHPKVAEGRRTGPSGCRPHPSRWRVWQRSMDPEPFVFPDETGATPTMTRRSGWGPKSERLVDVTPWGHWQTTRFVAGLRARAVSA